MAHLARSTEPARDDEPGDSRGPSVHRHRLSRRKKGSFWRELPILVLTALVLTFLIQTFLARVYVIPSASMEPTLHGCPGCTDDRVLVDKLTTGPCSVFGLSLPEDDWVLVDLVPGAAAGARGFYTGMVYDRDGRLLATIAQEHVMRRGEFR